jgi:hypothetical protein
VASEQWSEGLTIVTVIGKGKAIRTFLPMTLLELEQMYHKIQRNTIDVV